VGLLERINRYVLARKYTPARAWSRSIGWASMQRSRRARQQMSGFSGARYAGIEFGGPRLNSAFHVAEIVEVVRSEAFRMTRLGTPWRQMKASAASFAALARLS